MKLVLIVVFIIILTSYIYEQNVRNTIIASMNDTKFYSLSKQQTEMFNRRKTEYKKAHSLYLDERSLFTTLEEAYLVNRDDYELMDLSTFLSLVTSLPEIEYVIVFYEINSKIKQTSFRTLKFIKMAEKHVKE